MKTRIIPIGNSKGIRIPQPLLEESGLTDEVELTVKKGEIKIIPVVSPTVPDNLWSEAALATDWNRPEEDQVWKNL